jgi:hypothetical protein
MDPLPAYRMTIVDSRGREVWSSTVTPKGADLSVDIGTAPAGGRYWVRLLEPGSQGRLLREFGLDVK